MSRNSGTARTAGARRARGAAIGAVVALLWLTGCVDVGVAPPSEPCDCEPAADCDDVAGGTPSVTCEGAAPATGTQAGVCQGAVQVCRDGAWVEDLSVVAGWQAEEQSCDALDNDCDGETDEGLGEATCGVGACAHTGPSCVDGAPALCDPYEGATAEACNGADDDCDGDTDEDLVAPLAARQDGVCFDARQTCAGADGWQEPDYETVPDHKAPEVSCDGKDNDCDGATDEDDVCADGGTN